MAGGHGMVVRHKVTGRALKEQEEVVIEQYDCYWWGRQYSQVFV